MRDHLKEVFKASIDNNSESNFKFSTISPFNIRWILRVFMDYTWRKWKQRDPKWVGNYSNKINLFINLIKSLNLLDLI